MTWDTFTKAIKDSELDSGTQAQILIKLFKRAGYINKKESDISESSAKKWIDGTRNCKVSTYFPDEECVQKLELHHFFIRRPQDRLEKLQEILSKEIDDNSPIDCTTKDRDKFCWGLVNQFLDLLGFQRVDMPVSDLPTDSKSIPDTNENEIDKNTVDGQCPNALDNKITHQSAPQFGSVGPQFDVPQECKICLYCENWTGNMQDAYNNAFGTIGRCRFYSKETLSTENKNCNYFIPDYGRVLHYQVNKNS